MAEWKIVGSETMLTNGTMTEIRLNDTLILLARVENTYYATQAKCPHLNGDLPRGTLSGFTVTCPRHGSQFDVRDGHNVAWITKISGLARKAAEAIKKPQGLRTYRTKVQDGQVWVEIE